MNIRGDASSSSLLRQWVLCLLLGAMLLRAFVPVGYMPDVASKSPSLFKFVICPHHGSMVASEKGPASDDKAKRQYQPCAFSGLASVALPEAEAFEAAALIWAPAPKSFQLALHIPRARTGPVLGSRGPPALS